MALTLKKIFNNSNGNDNLQTDTHVFTRIQIKFHMKPCWHERILNYVYALFLYTLCSKRTNW